MVAYMRFFKGIFTGMRRFGHDIAGLVNVLLLLAVYILGVGITSIIARVARKRFLDTKIDKRASYWSKITLGKRPKGEYYRQF